MAAEFSVTSAVMVTLFASAMWGSWMQIIKRCPRYPIYATTMMIYSFSFLCLSVALAFLKEMLLPMGFIRFFEVHLKDVFSISFGGAAAALSVLTSLKLMRNAGLVVGTAISGAAGSITGVLVAIAKEGLPDAPHSGMALFICTMIIVLAGLFCSLASQKNNTYTEDKQKNLVQNILLLVAFVVLSNGYIFGTSSGNNIGMHPFLICYFLCSGAFFVMLAVGIGATALNRQWKEVFCLGRPKKPLVLSAIAAVCHYGGNLLSIICMPVLSATLSFLIGRSANIWTFFFGIYLGEFKNSTNKVKIILATGISLYAIGVVLIAIWFY